MRQDNSYVEALWVPETNDFGFLTYFIIWKGKMDLLEVLSIRKNLL